MTKASATREQLLSEVAALRARLAEVEARTGDTYPAPIPPELVGREVACRAFSVFVDAIARRGLPVEMLLDGTGITAAQITNPKERVAWPSFTRLMENAGRLWTDPELEAIGATIVEAPRMRPVFVAGRLVYSVTDVYLWAFGRDGPAMSMFAAEDGRAVEIEPGLLRLEIRMRPGYAPSRENFVAARGSLRGVAEAFGYGPAEVHLEQDPTGAVYHVRVPRGGGRFAWIRRSLGWLLAARRAGDELRAAHEDLHHRYLELRREIDARNASEVARRDLEADREVLLARLQLVMEGMPLGCLVFNPRGRLDYANPAAERMFGPLGHLHGGGPEPLFPEGPARDEVRASFERLLAGATVPPAVTDHVVFDGQARRCEWHHTPLRRTDGTFAGVVSLCEDVTEREREAARALQAQKVESIGRLAGGIAHDFNNLLSVVMGYAGSLEDEPHQSQAARDAIEHIQRACERGAKLASQLLAFGRQQVLDPRVLDLDEVVASAVRMLTPLLGEDVQVRVARQQQVGRVRADPTQIEQVIFNLAINARDAMPSGGHLVFETDSVDLDEAYVRTHADASAGPHVVLAVTDSGVGMDAETRARAFEPFYTTKPVGRGTGLGLSTVYGIVRQSGGHVTIYSEPGHGTTVKVYLPRARGDLEHLPASGTPDVRGGTETVLVVEDDEALRRLAVEVLGRQGYRVLAAASPAEALARIEGDTEPIHLLLTDVVMPGMTGVDLAQRATVARSGLRVLYTSGYAPSSLLREGALDDTVEFLPKPFTPSALANRVRAVLDAPSEP